MPGTPGTPANSPLPRWSPRQRLVLALARNLAPPLIGLLGATLRFDLPDGAPPGALAGAGEPAIYAFWHRCLLPLAWLARGRGHAILVSRHFDGEWIAQAAQRLGFRMFRGSSTRGGGEALYDMTAAVLAGQTVGLTVDGPRGPRFVAKSGAILLARATGAPIYPIHLEPDSCWTLRSWDRFQIPRPFSRVRGVWGEPLRVPAATPPGEIEPLRVELELRLNRLRIACETLKQERKS